MLLLQATAPADALGLEWLPVAAFVVPLLVLAVLAYLSGRRI